MTDLELIINNLRANAARYDKPDRYYRGDHDLSFATEKFENTFGSLFREFALNLCPAIVDSVRDKLKVTGFSLGPHSPSVGPQAASLQRCGGNANVSGDLSPSCSSARLGVSAVGRHHAADIHASIDALWSDCSLDVTAEEIHLEALKLGDAYVIVWPDDHGRVTIYPQRASACTVVYDDEIPGLMRLAAKYWRDRDGLVRLNLLYPDRIEKYVSRFRSELSLPDARDFISFSDASPIPNSASSPPARGGVAEGPTGGSSPSEVQNPFGQVPLFHFANTSEIGSFGRSELQQAIPIQNGLNKAVLDMLVAMEFSAFRQRWVTGLEVDYNAAGEPIPPFKIGADRLWLSSNPQTTFGDFNTTDLDQFLKVKDSFRVDIASVTGTPLHYFLQSIRGFASGEALGRAEARFIAKVRDRQRSFGQTWASLMSFALRVAGVDTGVRLRTQWEDPAPLSDKEFLENLVLKRQIGVPADQLLAEAGYGRSDIDRMVQTE